MNSRLQQVEWRRSQVLELSSKGYSQSEIAKILQIDKSTISRDTSSLREQCKENIRKYIDERLPEEYEKCLVGLTLIIKSAWIIVDISSDNKERMQALSIAKEGYDKKLELLTNATVVNDAIKFITNKSLERITQKQYMNNSENLNITKSVKESSKVDLQESFEPTNHIF